VGPFPLNWIAEAPKITRHFPSPIRTAFTNRCVKPGAAGWLLPGFGGVRVDHGRHILAAKRVSDRIELKLDNRTACYDHVLLATGYRTDIARLNIFDLEALARMRQIDGSPRLNANFECSFPGLYFVGSNAVRSFGPLVRFIAGAGYTARTVARAVGATHSIRKRAGNGTWKFLTTDAA
jgi:FAD-dependent urate hydroxylase